MWEKSVKTLRVKGVFRLRKNTYFDKITRNMELNYAGKGLK